MYCTSIANLDKVLENSRLYFLIVLRDDYIQMLLAFVICALFIKALFSRTLKRNSSGPIRISPTIPVIGHILGIYRHKAEYYNILSQKWGLPIFTLGIINQDIHIVTSTSLMPSIQRQHKLISLWQLEGQFTAQLAGLSAAATEKLLANVHSDSDTPSMMLKGIKIIQGALSPAGGMLDMLKEAASATTYLLDDLAARARNNNGKVEANLWDWVRHEVTLVITESLYGVENPFRDPEIEKGFWEFSEGSMTLLLPGFLKNIFASKAVKGRDLIVNGLRRYYTSSGYPSGSVLTKARFEFLLDKADDLHVDMSKNEAVNGIAVLANTIPTAYWAIFHLYSDSTLLKEIRNQVEGITTFEIMSRGSTKGRINLGLLQRLPILNSMLMETLRFRSTGIGPRMVLEDTFVGQDRYLLKKDSMVIIANRRLHFDKSVWGDTADTFCADRFNEKYPLNAFRSFGGGVNTCPGKGFVTPLMAAFIAMLVMRFDIIPAGNEWKEPGQDLSNMSAQIAPPKKKLMVDMVPREGMKNVTWGFDM